MRIEELNIRGYGRVVNLRLEPTSGLNLICGPPGAGKTTVCNCLRDVLLGPGRWDSPEGGPRGPHARPASPERFLARVRYRVGDAAYTVQRDFDALTTRVRDEAAGTEVAIEDPRGGAPLLVAFRFDDEAPAAGLAPGAESAVITEAVSERLQSLQARAEQVRDQAAIWEYCLAAATAADLDARLNAADALRQERDALIEPLARYAPYAQVARERRDGVIRAGERLKAVSREQAASEADVAALTHARAEVGARLSAYEPFFSITDADLETVRALEMSQGSVTAQIDEKVRNLEGFRAKESELEKRLEEVTPRFGTVTDHDGFEAMLADRERELGRSELLTAKESEGASVDREVAFRRASLRRWLVFALCFIAAGLLMVGLHFVSSQGGLVTLGIVVALLGIPMLVKSSADGTRLRELELERARVARDIEALQATVDAARAALRSVVEAVGVHTILETRSLHREYRSLLRDIETVRSYRAVLEKDLEAVRVASVGQRVETPRLLIDCGVMDEGDDLTPRVVAEFFERYHAFRAMRQEEEAARKRLSDAQGVLDQKIRERDALEKTYASSLADMGMRDEVEMETAIQGRREYDRLKAQVDVLEEKIVSALRGLDLQEALRQSAAVRRQLQGFVETRPELTVVEVAQEATELYRQRLQHAQQELAALQGETAGLEGGVSNAPSVPSPATLPASTGVSRARFERQVCAVWEQVTGRGMQVRARDAQGRLAFEVRERDDGPWVPSSTLGVVAANVLRVVVEGERARLGGVGAMPAIFDNPLEMLPQDWQERLAAWVVELSDAVQVFVTLSTAAARDTLRAELKRRGRCVQEAPEGDLQIVSAPCGSGI